MASYPRFTSQFDPNRALLSPSNLHNTGSFLTSANSIGIDPKILALVSDLFSGLSNSAGGGMHNAQQQWGGGTGAMGMSGSIGTTQAQSIHPNDIPVNTLSPQDLSLEALLAQTPHPDLFAGTAAMGGQNAGSNTLNNNSVSFSPTLASNTYPYAPQTSPNYSIMPQMVTQYANRLAQQVRHAAETAQAIGNNLTPTIAAAVPSYAQQLNAQAGMMYPSSVVAPVIAPPASVSAASSSSPELAVRALKRAHKLNSPGSDETPTRAPRKRPNQAQSAAPLSAACVATEPAIFAPAQLSVAARAASIAIESDEDTDSDYSTDEESASGLDSPGSAFASLPSLSALTTPPKPGGNTDGLFIRRHRLEESFLDEYKEHKKMQCSLQGRTTGWKGRLDELRTLRALFVELRPQVEAECEVLMKEAEGRTEPPAAPTTGCQASIGISHNILLTRLATRKAKPAGVYHLFAEEVDDFMAPLDVDELPGIGWSSREKLKLQLGVNTVGDLRAVPSYKLASVLGPENGKKFAAFAQGVDDRELKVGKARQSVSTEVNYGIRFPAERHNLVERFVRELGAETAKRLREQGLQAQQLTLEVMQWHPDAPVEAPKLLGHGWCTTENKVSTLAGRNGGAEDNGDVIGETAWKVMRSLQAPLHELRGIGIQLSKLEKDGVPVDLVMEKGPSRLSFKAGPRPAAESTPRASPPPAPPAPRATSPGPPQRTSLTETVTISSSPTEKDSPALSAAKLRAKATTRVGSEMPDDATLPAPKKAPPEVIVLPPSPSEMTDAQIAAIEYDPDMFRELGKATQREQIELHRNRQARLIVGNRSKCAGSAGAAHGGASGSRPRAPVKDVRVRQPPRFQGKVEIEDVEDRLEAWFHAARDGAPYADDLDALGRFIGKCAAQDKGQDLKKAVDVLARWSVVLEAEVGRRGERDGAAALWWEGYACVRERLEWLVLQETGCRLKT